MIKLLKNCNIYTPRHFGAGDILIEGSRIRAVEKDLRRWEKIPEIEVMDMEGKTVCPGIIDGHVHATGGGGEQGPQSRTPELQLTDFTMNGVTAVVALLGTDGISRSLENLLFKCMALEKEGLSTQMLTGNYRLPSKTLTGDVQRDIALVQKIIGVKLAIADHRSSMVTGQELARLASQARIGGMLTGKPGLVIIHMGDAPEGMEKLFWAVENSAVPIGNFLPTHCCRNPIVVRDAVRFNQMGGNIDFTADISDDPQQAGTAGVIMDALQRGAEPERITMTSDAGGSQPKFDDKGNCIGLTSATSRTLLPELRRLVEKFHLPLETALRFFTENPARILGWKGQKGVLSPDTDADILVLDDNFKVCHLFMKGKMAVKNGIPLMKGTFEN